MLSLTEDFTGRSNEVVCFPIFIYDSNKELTLNIELSLLPENKVKLTILSKRYSRIQK